MKFCRMSNTVVVNEALHLIKNELEFEEYKRAAKQFFNEIGEWSYGEAIMLYILIML